MNIPKMRTIPKAYEELKNLDANTSITIRALRRMVNKGELPVFEVGNKKLINMQVLIEKLSCMGYNEDGFRAS